MNPTTIPVAVVVLTSAMLIAAEYAEATAGSAPLLGVLIAVLFILGFAVPSFLRGGP